MGWISERKPEPHECVRPAPAEKDEGRIWECDECGKRWEVARCHTDQRAWLDGPYWREVA